MRRYLLLETKRALFSVPFLFAVAAATAAGLSGMLPEVRFGTTAGAFYVFHSFYSGGLALLAPLLATLPFSNSYASERNSGFSKSVMQRLEAKHYAIAKTMANALAGGLALALPVTGALLWANSTFPTLADPNGPPRLFGRITASGPESFMWMAVGLSFAFGATFAVVGLAVSVLFRSPYYSNVVPLAVYLVPAFIFGSIGLGYLDPPMMWEPANHIGTTPVTVGVQYAVCIVGAVVLFTSFLRVKEE